MLTKIKENQCFHQVTANDSYDTALRSLYILQYAIFKMMSLLSLHNKLNPPIEHTLTHAKHCICLACCYFALFPF